MNGDILKNEVSEDIKKLSKIEIDDCECDLVKIVPGALTRALRLGEAGYTMAKKNYYLLIVLILLVVKTDAFNLVKFIAEIMK